MIESNVIPKELQEKTNLDGVQVMANAEKFRKGAVNDLFSTVCRQCGLAANVLTCLVTYGEMPKQLAFTVSTFHLGVCDVCDRKTMVTESRDYFYPDFSLLGRKFLKALNPDC